MVSRISIPQQLHTQIHYLEQQKPCGFLKTLALLNPIVSPFFQSNKSTIPFEILTNKAKKLNNGPV